MEPGRLLAFALVALALIVIPGPSVLFVIGRALSLGRRPALATVAGNAVGEYVQVAAVALGIGAIVERSVALFSVVRLAGAAYLVFLGIRAILRRHALDSTLQEDARLPSRVRIMRDGFVVGLTNPKSLAFFVAVLPQFVTPGGRAAVQLLLLGSSGWASRWCRTAPGPSSPAARAHGSVGHPGGWRSWAPREGWR